MTLLPYQPPGRPEDPLVALWLVLCAVRDGMARLNAVDTTVDHVVDGALDDACIAADVATHVELRSWMQDP